MQSPVEAKITWKWLPPEFGPLKGGWGGKFGCINKLKKSSLSDEMFLCFITIIFSEILHYGTLSFKLNVKYNLALQRMNYVTALRENQKA